MFSGPFHHRRHYGGGGFYPGQVVDGRYQIIEKLGSDCSCKAGSGFEQKIKENPMVFVLGALLVGYLVAKKR